MQNDYISTDALHGLDYLAHARVYAHKYIRREPNGKGGWRYWYPTDAGSSNGRTYNSYAPALPTFKPSFRVPFNKLEGIASTNARTSRDNDYVYGGNAHMFSDDTVKTVTQLRNADKASEIYREGLPSDMPRGKRNASVLSKSGIKEKVNSKMPANRPTNVSKEYLEELESNSKKNNFSFDNATTWDNGNITLWENVIPENVITENIITEKSDKDFSSNNASRPNATQQTISTITTAARATYNAGMNFLKKLFS